MGTIPRILRGSLKPAHAGILFELPSFNTIAESKPVEGFQITEQYPWKKFFLAWVGIFSIIAALFYSFRLVPQGTRELATIVASLLITTPQAINAETPQTTFPDIATLPLKEPKLIIPAIGLNVPIVLPRSKDAAVLNTALAKSATHYPGSAMPGENGNVFILGHSSWLPIVHNKAYQAFNYLKDLKPGDPIRIQYGNQEYLYLAASVKNQLADDTRVDLITDKKMLTLSTCNVFGGKEARYIIQAEFVRSYPLRLSTSLDTSS